MPSSAWDDWKLWPKHAPDGCVFLAHAFDQLARAKFGLEWPGWKRLDKQLPKRIPTVDEAFHDGQAIGQVHEEWGPTIRRFLRRPDLAILDEDQWLDGRFRWLQALGRRSSALTRRQWLIDELTRLAQRGVFTTVHRLKDELEGDHRPVRMEADLWQISDPFARFAACAFDPKHPRDPLATPTAWLFATQSSLEQVREVLGITSGPPESCAMALPSAFEGMHLSPYLRLMLAVAKDMEITPDHQPLKKEITYQIQKRASQFGIRVSPTIAEYAATLLREEDSQAGKGATNKLKK